MTKQLAYDKTTLRLYTAYPSHETARGFATLLAATPSAAATAIADKRALHLRFTTVLAAQTTLATHPRQAYPSHDHLATIAKTLDARLAAVCDQRPSGLQTHP